MNTPAKALIAVAAIAVLASPILAQQRRGSGERNAGECRAEIVKLCGSDRSQMRACLREKRGELSDGCQSELRARMEARGGERGTRGGGAAA
ncbi:hypothetical protein ACLBKT_09095 [Erythrobacter sp. W302b]|uniref:hypothetical protein n=1 Tax=Erythrobacter sp. W302b TaxID=3389874 RepID=UPI00396AFF2E